MATTGLAFVQASHLIAVFRRKPFSQPGTPPEVATATRLCKLYEFFESLPPFRGFMESRISGSVCNKWLCPDDSSPVRLV